MRHVVWYTGGVVPDFLLAAAHVVDQSLGDLFLASFRSIGTMLYYAPYWAPFVLLPTFWHVWIRYVRAVFIAEQEYVLLEVRLPQEVYKSPKAMHAVFDGLWQRGGESTFIDRLWYGKVRLWYSFELVSTEGQVHLYVWVRAAFRKLTERTFYAHYPDAEITPVADYAIAFPFSLERYNLYGMDFSLASSIGVPIKTYTDYMLDKDTTKEEQKVDPLAHVLEFLGSLGKGEHAWIQILARAHRKEPDFTWGIYRTKQSYEEIARAEVAKMRAAPEETIVFPDGKSGKTLSDQQVKRMQAINKNLVSSLQWDVGMRGIYLAEHDHFDGTNITGLRTVWQPFNAPGYNSFSTASRWQDIFDYPWQDFNDIRVNAKKVKIMDAYRKRSWFHAPYHFNHFMLTSEELATLFHLPGTVAKTPTLQRISSTRSQAPANLPH